MRLIILFFSISLMKVECGKRWRTVTDYNMDLNSISPVPMNSDNPKSVNLALETSFFLEPKDFIQNVNFITNLKSFLDKLTTMIEPQTPKPKTIHKPRTDTDKSVKDIKDTLVKLSSSQWSDIYNAIASEYGKYKNGVNFRSGRNDIDTTLGDIINRISDITLTEQFKRLLSDYTPVFEGVSRRFGDVIKQEDTQNVEKIFDKVRRFVGKHNNDINKIVDDVLRFGVERYNRLDDETKMKLRNGINAFKGDDARVYKDERSYDSDGMSIETKQKKPKEIYEVLMDNLEFFVRPQLINM